MNTEQQNQNYGEGYHKPVPDGEIEGGDPEAMPLIQDSQQQIFENSDQEIDEESENNLLLEAELAFVKEAIDKEYQKKYD